MSQIKISRKSNEEAQVTFKKVESFFQKDVQLKKMDPTLKTSFDRDAFKCEIEGQKFKARLRVSPLDEGSQVEVLVNIPRMLSFFKGQIEKTLEEKLDQFLRS